MPIDLEEQLRTVGRTLDSVTSPVSVGEIRARLDNSESHVGEHADLTGLETGPGKRRWILLTAAAAVLVVAMIGSIAAFGRSSDPSTPAVSDTNRPTTPPPVEPTSTPPPTASTTVAILEPSLVEATITPARTSRLRPDLFPIVRDPDVTDAFGQYSAQANRTPLVTALVGRIDGDLLSDGIQIEVLTELRGEATAGDPQVVEIDGTDVDVYASGDTSTVVLAGEPMVAISGSDPVSFLRAAGLEVILFDPVNPFETVAINEAVLPDGYQTIVEPQAEPIDALLAYTATSLANSDGPNVSVSLTNPLASYAIRDVLERTQVNITPAWAAPRPGGYTIIWPISDSTWVQASVRGGPDETLTIAESIEFAADIDFVSETEWRANYRVPEPWFDYPEAFIGIDKGRADGIDVGMLVESKGTPIGQVARVTDSTSDVILVSNPEFSIVATAIGTTPTGTASECRVRGGDDHTGYVCDRAFNDQEQVGTEIVATGNSPTVIDGTRFGTITSIIDINGEPVGLLDLLTEFPIAGDAATVVVPS